MAIMRYRNWNPLRELSSLFTETPLKIFNQERTEFTYPALDVEDRPEDMIVRAEIPGVNPKDIEIELVGDQLHIRGEKKEEREEKKGKYYYKERNFGAFSRTVSLGQEIDPETVMAEYNDGILLITLRKAATKTAKKINIKTHE